SHTSVHRPASHATDFSLSCIKTHTTASTDPHRTNRIISNAYMRCVLMTSYGVRTMRTMRFYGRLPLVTYRSALLLHKNYRCTKFYAPTSAQFSEPPHPRMTNHRIATSSFTNTCTILPLASRAHNNRCYIFFIKYYVIVLLM
ncbi:hypothetical protein SFRURICE_006402, partial [Spodoptera frugiperda]